MDFFSHFFTAVDFEDITRVAWAAAAGGLIGLEREFRDKAAGFRTLILIAVGAALFTILSENAATPDGDPTKIAGYVVSGVGFLGAGAIMREGLHVAGLTTAATIWVTAAIGMAFGFGEPGFGVLITASMMIVLWIFPFLEHAIDKIREEDTYEMAFDVKKLKKIQQIEAEMRRHKLKIVNRHYFKKRSEMRCRWTTIGKPHDHERFRKKLRADSEITELSYH